MAIDPNWVRENPEEAARQIELLTIAGNLNRTLVEVHILQRQEMQKRVEELACQVEEAGRYLRDTARRDELIKAQALFDMSERLDAYDQPIAANQCWNRGDKLRRKVEGGISE